MTPESLEALTCSSDSYAHARTVRKGYGPSPDGYMPKTTREPAAGAK